MNTFYMMVGLPGCGKSSWIAENLSGALSVSSDAIIEQRAVLCGATYDAVFRDCIEEACRKCTENMASAIAEGGDVALDQTNLTVDVRAEKLQIIPATYRKIAVVILCGSAAELEQRRRRPGKTIAEQALTAMRDSFVFPTKAEGFDEIRVVIPSSGIVNATDATVTARGRLMKLSSSSGREYLAAEILEETVAPYLELLLSLVGEEEFHRHIQNKRWRDGGTHHLTIVDPDEYERSIVNQMSFGDDHIAVSLLGLGTAAAGGNRAYYIVAESDEIMHLRFRLGLPEKALHITLGFSDDDVHDASKGLTTIIAAL